MFDININILPITPTGFLEGARKILKPFSAKPKGLPGDLDNKTSTNDFDPPSKYFERIEQDVQESIACSSYKEEMHKRLSHLLQQFTSHSDKTDEYYVSYIADLLGEESSENLLKIFSGETYPDKNYLSKLSSALGVKRDWLESGLGHRVFCAQQVDDLNKLKRMLEIEKPRRVYFILNEFDPQKPSVILFEYNEVRFQLMRSGPYYLDINGVGCGGEREIVEFYQISELLHNSGIFCNSYCISGRKWEQLLDGTVWPGFVCGLRLKSNCWADDFRSLDGDYSKWFKEGWFVKSQDHVSETIGH